MRTRHRPAKVAGLVLLPLLLASCPKETPAPTEPPAATPVPTAIALVSGGGQTGTVGHQLSQPLLVRVTGAAGTGVTGVTVAWSVTAGGGSLSANSVATDAQGNASVAFTLGTVAGANNNTAAASVTGLAGSPATVTASANPGPASQLVLVSGNNQSGTVGAALAQALTVVLRDQFGNGVNGATVAWAVTGGGGSVSATSGTTNPQGHSAILWTLGTVAGTNNNSATASIGGLPEPPVTFTASGTPGSATQVALVSGNGQTGGVGQALGQPFVVAVRDEFNNGVGGIAVAWSVTAGGGSLSGVDATTDAQGLASARLTLGTNAGPNNNSVGASAGSLNGSPVAFTASAAPGGANQLVLVSGDSQTDTVGQVLAQPLRVAVHDQFGNAVNDALVAWAVTGGGGSLSATSSSTDAQGQASATWTLGTGSGNNNNTAMATVSGLSGSPVNFTASASPGAATRLAIVSGNTQTGTVGTLLTQALVVAATDQYGNGAGGTAVAWSVTGGGGSLFIPDANTNLQGQAMAAWTLGTVAGSGNNTVQAARNGLTGSPVPFSASADPDAASQIVLVSGNLQTGTAGQALAQPVVVSVQDQHSNGITGVTVSWGVTGGGGSFSAANTTSGAQGQTSATWMLGTMSGTDNNTGTAGVVDLAGSPIALTASADPGPATQMAAHGGDEQTGPAGSILPIALSVRVADTHGNGVEGVAVDWLVTAGGGSVSAPTSETNQTGIATIQRTLGPGAGEQTATAAVSGLGTGSPVEFTAIATPSATISGTITLSNALVAPPAVMTANAAGVRDVTLVAPSGTKVVAIRRPVAALVQSTPLPPRFTPDELIVTYHNSAVAAPPIGSAAMRSGITARSVGVAIRAEVSRVLGATPGVAVTGASPATLAARVRVDPSRLDQVAAILRNSPNVAAVERNAIVLGDGVGGRPSGVETTPNDPVYPFQAWHYAMIDLPEAWDITTGSASVLVAVVDDGIRFDHPAIAANLTGDGFDFVTNGPLPLCGGGTIGNAGDGGGYDANPTQPDARSFNQALGCVGSSSASGNHGLHVAGTIGAVGNDGVGVSGVNWTVRIRPVRVLGISGSGTAYDVAQGILYAAGLPADNGAGGTVQAGSAARIINLSLGSPSPSTVQENAVIAASNAGVLIIAAAGNAGTSAPNFPAAYVQVLSVSAVGPDAQLASYSSFGSTVDIAAPGGDLADGDVTFGVISTAWNFLTATPINDSYNGTSMATPHVAGVAALLLSHTPSLTAAQLRDRLVSFAVDLGPAGPDDFFGAGLLNARNSLAQTVGPTRQLYARLYHAVSGAVVSSMVAQPNGSFAFGGLADGSYHVFAGQDASGDGLVGLPGRRWGALGTTSAPTAITVSGTGIYPASFTAGFPTETEGNATTGTADFLAIGGWIYGAISPSSDIDAFRVTVPQAGQYTFETSGLDGACGFALEEDTILGLYDSGGTLITQNDDIDFAAENFCSRITMTLAAGTYFVAVTGYATIGANYRLQARSGG